MHRGIIRSALTSRLSLELDYREPSTDDGFAVEEMQPPSEEFASLLLTLFSVQENRQ